MNNEPTSPYQILLYYKYTKVNDPEAFVAWHKEVCAQLGFKGRILIAKEGINGTLEGLTGHTEEYVRLMHDQDGSEGTFGDFSDVVFKTSPGKIDGTSFPKMKVKARKEVVTLGLERYGEEDLDPNELTGIHLDPTDLKKWYESGEDFEIIDMRNDYEFKVGHFRNSINPEMENFRDLPKVLPALEAIKKASEAGKKVLTVCTGGIRCEKASGYLIRKGFKNVYQLDGGMHKFMEKYPGEDFLGSLYVFDGRETVDFMERKQKAAAAEAGRVVVGKCDVCQAQTEQFANCANIECHMKMLCCADCLKSSVEEAESLIADAPERESELRNILKVAHGFSFCSPECRECVINANVNKGIAVAA